MAHILVLALFQPRLKCRDVCCRLYFALSYHVYTVPSYTVIHTASFIVKLFVSAGFFEIFCSNNTFKASRRCFELQLLPSALNVATCSHMLLGWSGRGCHTRASTSCRRQRQGISDGLTSTVNRYWWLLRFTWRDTHRWDSWRCELKIFSSVLDSVSHLLWLYN